MSPRYGFSVTSSIQTLGLVSDFTVWVNPIAPAHLFKEITFTDMLTKPDAWGAAMNWYFGEYGKVKHQFMIDVTGEKWDDDYINSFINDYGYVTYLKSKLRTALDEENARRRAAGLGDLCEENGMLINWGQF